MPGDTAFSSFCEVSGAAGNTARAGSKGVNRVAAFTESVTVGKEVVRSTNAHRKTHHLRRGVLAVAISLALTQLVVAQTTTRPELPPPAPTASLDERLAWLRSTRSHSALIDVFIGVVSDLPTVADVLELSESVVPMVESSAIRHEALTRLASVARTARQLRWAADLYGAAFDASQGRDLLSLYNQAQVLLELGDLTRADELARAVVERTDDYELKRRATTLATRVLFVRGDLAIALKLLDTLTSLDDPAFVEPETIVLRLRIAEQIGDDEMIHATSELLQRLFPESVAHLVERNRDALPSPFPSSLLVSRHWESDGHPSEGPISQSTATRERLQPAVTAVQVGSFTDPDNAEQLAAKLRELEFDARAEPVRRDGLALHHVVVDVADGTQSAASRVIALLRDKGYDGFLVY